MSKYDPLGHFLAAQPLNKVPMTFAEIEKVLGFPLPGKSPTYRAWWSNNPQNNQMTKVWLEAGFQSEKVDLASAKLVFRRIKPLVGLGGSVPPDNTGNRELRHHPGFGVMKGLTNIAPNTDLTAPADPDWSNHLG
ncbi:MAG: DUF7662 domain-containing protein [Alphaproteobacteria bacterium]